MRGVVNLCDSGGGKSRLARALGVPLRRLQGDRAISAFMTEIAP